MIQQQRSEALRAEKTFPGKFWYSVVSVSPVSPVP